MKCTLRNVPVYRVAQVMWNIHLLLIFVFLLLYLRPKRRVSTTTCDSIRLMWSVRARDSVFRMCARFFIRSWFLLLFILHTYTFIYTLATSFNSYMVRVCISTEPIEPTVNSESKKKTQQHHTFLLTYTIHHIHSRVHYLCRAIKRVHVFDDLNKLKKRHTVSKYVWISVAARLIRTEFNQSVKWRYCKRSICF